MVLDGDNILARIISDKREEVAERSRRMPAQELRSRCKDMPAAKGFVQTMRARIAGGDPAIIAEVKKASPSRGLIREDFSPSEIAVAYEQAGASCVSVLTDTKYFRGEDEHLVAVSAASTLPVLRKDFTIDKYQVWESRQLGADCILLIVAVLEDVLLQELGVLATELGMDVLVEVHDEEELGRALALGLPMIGINNRDLRNFSTSLDTTIGLSSRVPRGYLLVTESGINNAGDVARLRGSGVHAFLVGEALMRANDPGEQLLRMFFPGGCS